MSDPERSAMEIQPQPETERLRELYIFIALSILAICVFIFYFGFYMHSYAHGMPRAEWPERLGFTLLFSTPFIFMCLACLRKVYKIKNKK